MATKYTLPNLSVNSFNLMAKYFNSACFQNSKYSSSKGSYGSGGERYERLRDSPNGNSYRSDSPESASPRDRLIGPDRSYQSKSSYLQKIREKERENRDYKLCGGRASGTGGYTGSSECRSPKDKRSKDSEHRTNHDREREREREEKLALHVGGLKHTSSSSSGGGQRSSQQQERKLLHNSCQDKVSRSLMYSVRIQLVYYKY